MNQSQKNYAIARVNEVVRAAREKLDHEERAIRGRINELQAKHFMELPVEVRVKHMKRLMKEGKFKKPNLNQFLPHLLAHGYVQISWDALGKPKFPDLLKDHAAAVEQARLTTKAQLEQVGAQFKNRRDNVALKARSVTDQIMLGDDGEAALALITEFEKSRF